MNEASRSNNTGSCGSSSVRKRSESLSLKALRYCIPRVEKVDRQQIESDAADSSERKLAMLPMSSGGKGISARSPGHEDLEATDRGPGGC